MINTKHAIYKDNYKHIYYLITSYKKIIPKKILWKI
jgi:hypothetical protein